MLKKNVFPSLRSLRRRGGCAIKKNDAEGHQSWRGRGGQSSKRVWNAVRDISSELTTPVCACFGFAQKVTYWFLNIADSHSPIANV